jgi:hypothetical protein
LTSPAAETLQPLKSARALAVDHEAAAAGGDRREVDGSAAGLAEDDVAAPGNCPPPDRSPCPDDQVGQTVAIDVAGRRDAEAT